MSDPFTPPAHHRRFYVIAQNPPENAEPVVYAEGILWRDGLVNLRGESRNGHPGSWFYNSIAALEYVLLPWKAEILWVDPAPGEIEAVARLRRQVAAAAATSGEDSENNADSYAPKYRYQDDHQ